MDNNTKSKFTELIAVRFTEQELTRLQEAAADEGIGASTLIRILVNQALKPTNVKPRRMTSDEFQEVMVATLARLDTEKVKSFLKDISIGNPDAPSLLVWAGQTKNWEEYTSVFLKALLASLGIEVIMPENQKSGEADNQPAGQTQEIDKVEVIHQKGAGNV